MARASAKAQMKNVNLSALWPGRTQYVARGIEAMLCQQLEKGGFGFTLTSYCYSMGKDGMGWDGKDELMTDEEIKAKKIEKIRTGALLWAPLQLPHSPVVGDATPTRTILSGGVPPEYTACSLCEKTSTSFAAVIAGRTSQFHSRCWKIYRGG